MYQRAAKILTTNSFFLFGARGTGKTTLLKQLFNQQHAYYINLLDPRILNRFQAYPDEFSKEILACQKEWIIVDEVQKAPALLDLVHYHIEEHGKRFVLTVSSARKLKLGAANLLAGRAFVYKLFPLTHRELGNDFDLDNALSFGTFPNIYSFNNDEERKLFLYAYADTYLKEEILEEQIVRTVPPFRRFLDIAAQLNSEQIALTNLARDIASDAKTVSRYYTIMEDTLLGFFVEPYHTSIRKRLKQAPKFYWIDTGLVRALTGSIETKLLPNSFEYETLFESFIVNEIHRLLTYKNKKFNLSFIRTKYGAEIDLVLERPGMPTALIEIKSSRQVTEQHIKGLKSFLTDFTNCNAYCLSNDKRRRSFGKIVSCYWEEGLKELDI
jgi:predicted AAA+ superfamily ATPase